MRLQNSKYIVLAGFAIVIVTVVLVGATGLYQLAQFNAQRKALSNTNDIKHELVYQLLSYSRERAISLTLQLNLEDPFERDTEYLRYNQLGALFASSRRQLIESGLTHQETELLKQQGAAVTISLANSSSVAYLSQSNLF